MIDWNSHSKNSYQILEVDCLRNEIKQNKHIYIHINMVNSNKYLQTFHNNLIELIIM